MNRSLVTFIGAFLLCGLGAATARAEKPENCASGIWQVALHTTPSTASEALATLTALRNNPHLSEEVATDTITAGSDLQIVLRPSPLIYSNDASEISALNATAAAAINAIVADGVNGVSTQCLSPVHRHRGRGI